LFKQSENLTEYGSYGNEIFDELVNEVTKNKNLNKFLSILNTIDVIESISKETKHLRMSVKIKKGSNIHLVQPN